MPDIDNIKVTTIIAIKKSKLININTKYKNKNKKKKELKKA